MKNLYKIARYLLPYWRSAILNLFFNILGAVFSIISLTMVIPFLGVLFGTAEPVAEAPAFALNKDALLGNLNYTVYQLIAVDGAIKTLLYLCVFIVFLFLFKNIFVYLAMYILAPVRTGIVRDLRNEIYRKILRLPLSFYTDKRKGDLIARTTTDLQEVEWSVMRSFELFFREPVSIVFFLVTLIILSPGMTLFVIILLPVTGLAIGSIGRQLRKRSAVIQRKMGDLLSTIEESISGLRVIKGFNAIDTANAKFRDQNAEYSSLMVNLNRKGDLASPLSEFMGVGVMVVILWFGGRMVMNEEISLDPEVFIAYMVIFSQLITPVKSLTTAWYQVQKGIASLDRINEVLDTRSNITDMPDAKPIEKLKSGIEFRNVVFNYDKKPVLKDISFTLTKGKSLALVGASGSGKTTIANLIPRFYDINGGELLIDGIAVKEYKIADLRSLFGIVTQETILFNDSIGNNISFGIKNTNQNDIESAARIANAHDFISEMEEGYNTRTGDRGVKLSGGQRQRISIARAVLRNPPILILDEATSALDTTSEKIVQEAISGIMKGRTTIIIAHRLSTVKHADEILVIDKGEIVERGKYSNLMDARGRFYELQQIQKSQ